MNKIERIRTFKDFVGELTVTYKRTSLPKVKANGSQSTYEFLLPFFDECMDSQEEFKILHLSNTNRIVNIDHHSIGTKTGCLADISIILRNALAIMTKKLIISHNHPSGSLKPSNADIDITKKIKEACLMVDLKLIDSIILTRESYYSFADEGIL